MRKFGRACKETKCAYRQRPLCVPSKFCAYRQSSVRTVKDLCAYRQNFVHTVKVLCVPSKTFVRTVKDLCAYRQSFVRTVKDLCAYRQSSVRTVIDLCAYRQSFVRTVKKLCAYCQTTLCVSLKCCSKLCKKRAHLPLRSETTMSNRSQSMIAGTEALLTTNILSASLSRTCSIVKLAKHKQRCQRAGRAQDCQTPPVLIRCTSDLDRSQRPSGTYCATLSADGGTNWLRRRNSFASYCARHPHRRNMRNKKPYAALGFKNGGVLRAKPLLTCAPRAANI